MVLDLLAAVALTAWLSVLFLPSGPWRTRERLVTEQEPDCTDNDLDLSAVTVLIPARNEAAEIGATLRGLAAQGRNLQVVVIDDQSTDPTAAAARHTNSELAHPLDLTIVDGQDLPPGWGGKLWALEQGVALVRRDYCLLLDAEIVLDGGVLGALLRKAEDENRAMVSVMAMLRCQTFWEKLLVPPFIYFFKMLYPFASVNDPQKRSAAAAGGCILIRTEALREIGGFAAIRDALIDDCTLAACVKGAGHSIWLGLSESVTSARAYPEFESFRRMVTRTAFTQLHYSAVLLGLVVAIMIVVFAVPLLALILAAAPWGQAAGLGALVAMSASFWPTIRLYRLRVGWALTLPVAGILFLAMTLESAFKYWRGVTAEWKGRTYRART
jgi:hopene-associated glycosyltransferase HpnB